ncbi:MAG: lipoprotein insertase outer membrane protein LolB [Cytophagales bacterium]|nr:lipoprotein insertase outer membrane protein LolB [Cytophagales bacterium]
MTTLGAGMAKLSAGMTQLGAGVTQLGAGMAKVCVLLFIVSLVGCASPPKPASTVDRPAWSGRLSIKIDATDTAAAQQNTAGFTLSGNPQAGQLDLLTPLGSKAAQVLWDTGFATLTDGKVGRRFLDLADALESVTGAKIPVSNLFGWLQGKQDKALEASMGWEVDLTRLAEGRIIAIRVAPQPRIELRVVLEP